MTGIGDWNQRNATLTVDQILYQAIAPCVYAPANCNKLDTTLHKRTRGTCERRHRAVYFYAPRR